VAAVKIAVSCDGNMVSAHFGRCEKFVLFEEENGKLKAKSEVACPPHEPGFIPGFLSEKGAQKIVCQGIGPRAISLFEELGIEVIAGVSGSIDIVIGKYLEGILQGSASTCDHF